MAEAVAAASAGRPRYLGVTGRVDSADEWEDEDHRPLVLRRRRLELRQGSRWVAFEDHREVVPFEISEGLDRIAVDGDSLDEGLVVVTRESMGSAADLADRVPEGTTRRRRPGCGSSCSRASTTSSCSAYRRWILSVAPSLVRA